MGDVVHSNSQNPYGVVKKVIQGHNQEFQKAGVGWIVSSHLRGDFDHFDLRVDLRGFGKWGQKAVTNKAHKRFPTKREEVVTPSL